LEIGEEIAAVERFNHVERAAGDEQQLKFVLPAGDKRRPAEGDDFQQAFSIEEDGESKLNKEIGQT
jgi:hypothetical protein